MALLDKCKPRAQSSLGQSPQRKIRFLIRSIVRSLCLFTPQHWRRIGGPMQKRRSAKKPDTIEVSGQTGSKAESVSERRVRRRKRVRARAPVRKAGDRKARTRRAASSSIRGRKKRGRQTYPDALRNQILETARKLSLTAAQVQERFGVKPITYYSWRRKLAGLSSRPRRGRGSQPGVLESGVNLVEAVRAELRNQIQQVLPELLRSEVGAALFGRPPRKRRRRR